MYENAQKFLKQYAYETDQDVTKRLEEIEKEIKVTGTYMQTFDELSYGAKLAWRNSNRCIGRLFWNQLHVFDYRNLNTKKEIKEALLSHIKYATNSGRIRPVISVFSKKVRIWNHQLIRYAGDEHCGDPHSQLFTKVCKELGWERKNEPFQILPIVVQIEQEKPFWFELSSEDVLEVPLRHPTYEWFEDLKLKWYAVPIISDMCLEIGGITYPAAPFNGYYMGTEIGSRNLGDEQRYDLLPLIKKKMNLDTPLWKDRALVELNEAVLYSFQSHQITIVDHHQAAKQFKLFEKKEEESGREVTGNWTWLIPPLSPSATHIFHQTYSNKTLSPNFFNQDTPY